MLCGESLHLDLVFQGGLGVFQRQSKKSDLQQCCVCTRRQELLGESGLYVKNEYVSPAVATGFSWKHQAGPEKGSGWKWASANARALKQAHSLLPRAARLSVLHPVPRLLVEPWAETQSGSPTSKDLVQDLTVPGSQEEAVCPELFGEKMGKTGKVLV